MTIKMNGWKAGSPQSFFHEIASAIGMSRRSRFRQLRDMLQFILTPEK
jgi:hypothetical protein